MDKATQSHFKELFTNLIEDADLGAGALEDALTAGERGDVIDQALGDRDQQLALKLKGRQSHFIRKVELALKKIENGTFGTCEDCDCDIELGRLMARPTATLCITCKEEQEISEQHIIYQKKSHTHGNELGHSGGNVVSLKLNDDGSGIKKANGLGRTLNI